MALYVVVHHPSDPEQFYVNEWDRNQLLQSFQADKRFVRKYAEALQPGKRIFIHRCAWGNDPAVIYSVEVLEVTPFFVRVTDVRLMPDPPPYQPMRGCGHYEYG